MVDIAQEAFATNNFDVSAAIYQNLIEETGPNVVLLLGLADSIARQGQIDQALPYYMKAFTYGQVTPEMLKHLVICLVDMVKGKERKAQQSDCVVIKETDPFQCAICECVLSDAVTLPCGHSFCRRCLERDQSKKCKTCNVTHTNLDKAQLKTNVLLTRIVEKWLFNDCKSVRLKQEGNTLFEAKSYHQAIEKYNLAIELAPDDHLLASNRSSAYAAMGNYAKALSDAEIVIKLKPEWPKGHYRKGVALTGLGRHDEAAAFFLQSLTFDSEGGKTKTALAQSLHKTLAPVQPENMKHSELQVTGRPSPLQLLANTMPTWPPRSESGAFRRGLTEALMSKAGMSGSSPMSRQQGDFHLHRYCNLGGEASGSSSSQTQMETDQGPAVPRLVKPELISVDDFECMLCYRLLFEPITTPCGHTYCRQCLDRCMDHNPQCPTCRFHLAEFLSIRLTTNHKAVTTAVQGILEFYLHDQVTERERIYREELEMLAQIDKVDQPEIPIFVCTMGYPAVPCPLHIFEPRYRLMVRRAMEAGTRQFGMCLGTEAGYSDVGTMLVIRNVEFFPDGRSVIDTIGGRRFRVLEKKVFDGYHSAKVEFLTDAPENTEALKQLCTTVYEETSQWVKTIPEEPKAQILRHFGEFPENTPDAIASPNGPSWVWWITAVMPLDPRAQLAILGMNSLKKRLEAIKKVLTFVKSR